MRETKSDRTKAFILEKVSPIFNYKGYSGTSLTDVLNATGLTKGAIYGNFENKEDLAQRAFRYNLIRVINPLQEELQKNKSATKKLKAITGYYREYYSKMEQLGGCPILNVVNDAKGVNETLLKAATKASRSMITQLEEIIMLGIEQGKIKRKTNARELSLLMFSMIQGAVFSAHLHKSKEPLAVTMDALDSIIQSNRKSNKEKTVL